MIQGLLISKLAGSVIRHGMTALGGVLLAGGYADAGAVEAITGGGIALAGVILSLMEKSAKL